MPGRGSVFPVGTRALAARWKETEAAGVIELRGRYLRAWEQNPRGPITSAVRGGLLARAQVRHQGPSCRDMDHEI